MPHYELVFETGATSVAFYEDEAEMLQAVGTHHKRAIAGEDGGPTGHPAERVVKVLQYDEHPGDLAMSQMVDAEEVKAAVREAIDKHAMGGQVSVPEIAAAVRNVTNPLVEDKGRHDSAFKMNEVKTFTEKDWSKA